MPEAQINGFRHYWEQAGDGEPLIMLHGAAGSAHSIEPVMPVLSRRFQVIAPDLRGMGRSEHVAELPARAWVEDLLGLIDHLGLERAHLYGRSLGARIAMRTAVDYPDRVTSLVVDGPLVAVEAEGEAILSTQFSGVFDERRAREYELWHGADWRTVVANYGRMRAQPDLQAYLTVRPDLPKIQCPVLSMRGDRDDKVHPLAHTLEVYRSVPRGWLWVVPNVGYSVLLHKPWHEQFLAVYERFLVGWETGWRGR